MTDHILELILKVERIRTTIYQHMILFLIILSIHTQTKTKITKKVGHKKTMQRSDHSKT